MSKRVIAITCATLTILAGRYLHAGINKWPLQGHSNTLSSIGHTTKVTDTFTEQSKSCFTPRGVSLSSSIRRPCGSSKSLAELLLIPATIPRRTK